MERETLSDEELAKMNLTEEELASLELPEERIETMNASKVLLGAKLERLKTGAQTEKPAQEYAPADPLDEKNLKRSFGKAVETALMAMLEASDESLTIETMPKYENMRKMLMENEDAILEMAKAKYGHEEKTIDEAMSEATADLLKSQEAGEQTAA